MALGDSIGLLFRIKGDESDAVRALKNTDKELDKLTGTTSGLSGAFSALGGPAGIATAGITALSAGAAAAGLALFNLTKSTAEYGSAIKDAADKTGASTDSLQALKYAAEQSGSSFEGVTNAVAKFNVLIGNATAGNEKADKILKQYGITSRDTDSALVQAISTIAKMTDSTEQAAAAGALFKDRTGEILPVIKSFNGDLPGLVDHLKDLGLIMSRQGVEAADEFGDQMDTLNKQLAGAGRTIGEELMPAFLEMAQEISAWLSANKGEVAAWADSILSAFSLIRAGASNLKTSLDDLDDFLRTLFEGGTWQDYHDKQAGRAEDRIFSAEQFGFEKEKARYEREMDRYRREMARLNRLTTGIPSDSSAGGGKKAVKDQLPKFDFSDEMRDYQKALRSLSPGLRNQILQYAEQYGIPASLAFAQLFSESGFRANVSSNQNAHGIGQLQPATASKALGRKVSKADLFDVDTNLAAWGAEMSRLFEKYGDWALAVLAYHGGEGTANAFLKASSSGETSLAAFAKGNPKSARYAQKIPTLAGLSKAEQIGTVDIERELKKEDALNEKYAKENLKRLEAIKKFEQEAFEQYLEHGAFLADAAQAEFNAEMDRQDERKKRWEEDFGTAGPVTNLTAPLPGLTDPNADEQVGPFDGWLDSWDRFFEVFSVQVSEAQDLAGTFSDFLTDSAGMLEDAFQGVAHAIGNVVQQWVLYGKTGPAVMRQILASALASVAAEAAVKAIMATAEGFYFLATHQYASAANAFTAAAFYGTVAGVAAIAGRAVAGNSFNQQANQATGRGGSSSGSASRGSGNQGEAYSSREDRIIEQGRNSPTQQKVIIEYRGDGFAQLFKTSIERNGPLRQTLKDAVEG